MRAIGQPFAAQHGLAGIGACADDVGAPHGVLEGSADRGPELSGERLGVVAGAARDAYLGKVAHPGDGVEVRTTLNAGPEHCEHAGVLSCERAGCDSRRRAGADCRDRGPVHEREWQAGLSVEQGDQRLMRGQAVGVVARKNRDELRLEHAVEIAGHRAEQATSLHVRGRSRRHRGATGAQLDECTLEGIEQELQVEQPANLGLCEDEHG